MNDRRLVPCSACRRHVRVDEVACPFCEAALLAPPPARVLPQRRLGSVAWFTFALAAGACGGISEEEKRAAPESDGGVDAGSDAGEIPGDNSADGGGVIDAGEPPVLDSGVDDPYDGGGTPIYRAVPNG
jgi:hypothetical protein